MNNEPVIEPYSYAEAGRNSGWSAYHKSLKERGDKVYAEGETLKWQRDQEAETARARTEMAKENLESQSSFTDYY